MIVDVIAGASLTAVTGYSYLTASRAHLRASETHAQPRSPPRPSSSGPWPAA